MICGEGPHDVGKIEQWSIKTNDQVIHEGWLQPLLRKYAGTDIEFEIVPRARLVKLPGPNKTPLPEGHGTKAYLAKFRAKNSECDAVIFMADADTANNREWAEKLRNIHQGFDLVESDVVAIACVPKSTSESWLLADKSAWEAASGTSVGLPKAPEIIWGRKAAPESDHPHARFSKACAENGLQDCTETRRALMEGSSIDTLKSKCPESFSAFDKEALALIQGT